MVSLTEALFSNNNVSKNAASVGVSAARLAAGKRIQSASQDIAALATGTALNTEVIALRASLSNASQASSLLQIADGGLGQQLDILQRQRALSVQASSSGIDDATRSALNQEFQGLSQELDRLAGGTNFNGQTLLDGSSSPSFTLGNSSDASLNVTLPNTTASSLFGGASVSIATQAQAQSSLADIDTAITAVSSARASVGSFQSRIDAASNQIQSAIASQDAAQSALLDTDIAAESSSFAAASVLLQASIATRAQGNKLSSNLLTLIQ